MATFLKARCPVCNRFAPEKWWTVRLTTPSLAVMRQTVTSRGRGAIQNEIAAASGAEEARMRQVVLTRLAETAEALIVTGKKARG